MKIFNERLVQDIINNFDPYEIQMNTDIELNKTRIKSWKTERHTPT